MTASRTLARALILLSFLPLRACHPDAALFSTRSPRPWTLRKRWRLPLHRFRTTPPEGGPGSTVLPEGLSGMSNSTPIPVTRHFPGNGSSGKTGPEWEARRTFNHLPLADDGVSSSSPHEGLRDPTHVGMQRSQILYALGLLLWLVVLIYLLGTTASDYFSCTLEKLSDILNLSPAVAGVTLLAIGNGAPDVFSTVIAFAASDHTGSIGFGSVLGGALFITTVVTGTVALVTSKGKEEPGLGWFRRAKGFNPQLIDETSLRGQSPNGSFHLGLEDGQAPVYTREKTAVLTTKEAEAVKEGLAIIDSASFIRDISFLLLSVIVLVLIILDGVVELYEAICFLCVYLCYTVFVWTVEIMQSRRRRRRSSLLEPLIIKDAIENAYPQWAEVGHAQDHPHPHPHFHVHSQEVEEEIEDRWEDPNDKTFGGKVKHWLLMFYKYGIERVLAWPRQLTIPVVEEERWSRKLAITSSTLAPVFIAAVWSLYYSSSAVSALVALGLGACVGAVLGSLAFFSTDEEQPPQNYLTLWLVGGFVMSIVWFYLVASELVESLEILGNIFGISTSILALTVLAWGNSVGDLVADIALACSGPDGVQIAISGCYAGPLFNIVVGLGLSLIIGSWNSEPEAYQIVDKDGSLFYIVGFLAVGLIWAAVLLPLQGMRAGRVFGISLIVLYAGFFVVGMCYAAGVFS